MQSTFWELVCISLSLSFSLWYIQYYICVCPQIHNKHIIIELIYIILFMWNKCKFIFNPIIISLLYMICQNVLFSTLAVFVWLGLWNLDFYLKRYNNIIIYVSTIKFRLIILHNVNTMINLLKLKYWAMKNNNVLRNGDKILHYFLI